MIITCPACQAQYLLPDDSIGANGRRVKCTSCAYTWLQSAEGENDLVAAKEVNFDPENTVKQRRVADTRITPVVPEASWKRTIGTGAGVAGFMLVVTLGFLFLFKDYAVSQWQPLALVYQSAGFAVPSPGTGISLEKVTAELDEEKALLSLKGTIANHSKESIKLPKFLVRLSGEKGWLKDWSINLFGKVMKPDESVGFAYSLQDAPTQGREVTLRFAD